MTCGNAFAAKYERLGWIGFDDRNECFRCGTRIEEETYSCCSIGRGLRGTNCRKHRQYPLMNKTSPRAPRLTLMLMMRQRYWECCRWTNVVVVGQVYCQLEAATPNSWRTNRGTRDNQIAYTLQKEYYNTVQVLPLSSITTNGVTARRMLLLVCPCVKSLNGKMC